MAPAGGISSISAVVTPSAETYGKAGAVASSLLQPVVFRAKTAAQSAAAIRNTRCFMLFLLGIDVADSGSVIFKGTSVHSVGWIFSKQANRTMQEDLSVAT